MAEVARSKAIGYVEKGLETLRGIRRLDRGERREAWNGSDAVTWFGESSQRALRQTIRRLDRTLGKLESAKFVFDAKFYSGIAVAGSWRMHLNPRALLVGGATGAALLIHESAHLAVAGGDFRYFSIQSRSLAQSSPWLARWNAENYSFSATSVSGVPINEADQSLGRYEVNL